MDFYVLSSLILSLAILIAYFNHRFIRMQPTIAIMVSSLIVSLLLILASKFGFHKEAQKITTTLASISFEKLLMNGMLSFLLFAGALTIDIHTLRTQRWEIISLSSVSTIVSTLLIGIVVYLMLPLIGIHLAFIYCLLFGALISPTDPIAVLATFKKLKAPKELNTTVAGESLFNDGVGIVLFLSLFHLAFTNQEVTTLSVLLLFLQQAVGGIVYGLMLGFVASQLIKNTNDHKLEILLTLVIVTGGYALAQALGISGPLAMVISGIIVGSYGRKNALSIEANSVLNEFWELIDEILNSVLFLLIGFELLIVAPDNHYYYAALLAIPIVLLARYVTVAIPIGLFKLKRRYCPHMINILVWGGLRGGLAVALALSLPEGGYREIILAMTYSVVAFAIIVQGMTINPLIKLAKVRLPANDETLLTSKVTES